MKFLLSIRNTLLFIAIALLTQSCGSEDPIFYFNKAVKFAESGNWQEAEPHAEKSYDIYQDKDNGAFYALCLEKREKRAEARLILQELADKHQNDPIINYLYAKHLYDNGIQGEQDYGQLGIAFEILSQKVYKQELLKQLPDEYRLETLAMLIHCSLAINNDNASGYFQYLSHLKNLKADPIMKNNIGVWYARQKDFSKATSELQYAENFARLAQFRAKRSGKPAPATPSAVLLNKAIINDYKKEYESAVKYYTRYIETIKDQKNGNYQAVAKRINDLKAFLNK